MNIDRSGASRDVSASMAISGMVVLRMIQEVPDSLTRIVVPGEAELDLTEPGSYTIYHEHRSVVDGQVFSSTADISSLLVAVERPTGNPRPCVSPLGTSSVRSEAVPAPRCSSSKSRVRARTGWRPTTPTAAVRRECSQWARVWAVRSCWVYLPE